jgi:uncharacterized protein (TIGR03118 family)
MNTRLSLCFGVFAAGALMVPASLRAQHYQQTNLVSNVSGATVTDANLVNAWGLVRGSGGPWWISDAGTGKSTVYNGDGALFPLAPASPLVVTVPGHPAGIVYNGSAAIFHGARFIFSTLEGSIATWSSGTTQAVVVATTAGAAYTGLTIAKAGNGKSYLYASDFHGGRIDVFDTNFQPVSASDLKAAGDGEGGDEFFQVEDRPDGFAPFNVQAIGDNLIVTYAMRDPKTQRSAAGPGLGSVAAFGPDGRLLRRFQTGSWLNAPWGVALAPTDFGGFSHDLLIGQFGSGLIAAYNVMTGAFDGLVLTTAGLPLTIDGLWALSFGDGKTSGAANALYFTAGPKDETNGLFGRLTPVTTDQLLGSGR